MTSELDNTTEENLPSSDPEKESSAKSMATLVYALQAVSFLLVITYIGAIVLNYIKKDDVQGTLAESHFRWQMRTFWFSVLWGVLGFILLFVVIGYVVLLANTIWVIYRIVKGWLNLNDNKPMYA